MFLKSVLPPKVQLIGPVDPHAALTEQVGQHAVDDGGADLALDVVADDRQAALLEAPRPGRIRTDEHRDAVDEGAAGGQRLLGVELGGRLRAHRQIGHQDVGAAASQFLGHVAHRFVGLFDVVRQVLADAVERGTAAHLNAERALDWANCMVLLGAAAIASDRSRPTLPAWMSNAAASSMSLT
jgi:hypothetical protein